MGGGGTYLVQAYPNTPMMTGRMTMLFGSLAAVAPVDGICGAISRPTILGRIFFAAGESTFTFTYSVLRHLRFIIIMGFICE